VDREEIADVLQLQDGGHAHGTDYARSHPHRLADDLSSNHDHLCDWYVFGACGCAVLTSASAR
jgi:hypothetical protein